MPPLADIRAANAASKPAYKPVALFVGGTSGIGQASAEAIARYTAGNAHIILSGRNETSAKSIIASFPTAPTSEYEFLPCDATLMSNISTACASLTSRPEPLKKLNYLVFTLGFISFGTREETEEGLDKKMALDFYGRWKFVLELMPLLEAAKAAGEDVRVVSVLTAGRGREVDLDDLELRKGYGIRPESQTASTYNDLMVEEFATRHPGISFVHTFPGAVRTPGTKSLLIIKLLYPLFYLLSISQEDSAEYQVYPLLNAAFSEGGFHIDTHDDPIARMFVTEEAKTKVYEHLIHSVTR